jgi:hypothetical protein
LGVVGATWAAASKSGRRATSWKARIASVGDAYADKLLSFRLRLKR